MNGNDQFCIRVTAGLLLICCSYHAEADSICLDVRSTEALTKVVRYSILGDAIRFDLDVDAQDQTHVVRGANLYFDVPQHMKSIDSIEEADYALSVPLELTRVEGSKGTKFRVSMLTRTTFENFVIVLVLGPKEQFECYCAQYELLNVSNSQIDFKTRFGEVNLR